MLRRITRRFSEELVRKLTPHQYFITQGKGLERPYTGEYWDCRDIGTYHCIVCTQPLFHSQQKFFPDTGHCAFWGTQEEAVKTQEESEVQCAKCSAHLGTLSEDGPVPTGLHYQIKSGALKFEPMPWFEVPPTKRQRKEVKGRVRKK